MEHEDHLAMMTTHPLKTLLLVERGKLHIIATELDSTIWPINRYKFTRTLTPQKLNIAETDVSSLLGGMRCVVICYDLWMSKTTHEIFQWWNIKQVSMSEHIVIIITISTDREILAVPVGNIINQFSLGPKIVGITGDGGTNLSSVGTIPGGYLRGRNVPMYGENKMHVPWIRTQVTPAMYHQYVQYKIPTSVGKSIVPTKVGKKYRTYARI